jgi:hypothetical protein
MVVVVRGVQAGGGQIQGQQAAMGRQLRMHQELNAAAYGVSWDTFAWCGIPRSWHGNRQL